MLYEVITFIKCQCFSNRIVFIWDNVQFININIIITLKNWCFHFDIPIPIYISCTRIIWITIYNLEVFV